MEGQSLRLDEVPCDAGVAVTDGEAGGKCGDVPLMITRTTGEGEALLLNFPMAAWPRLDQPTVPAGADALLLRLAASAGIRPTLRVTTGGKRTRNLEIARWRNGDYTLAALWRHKGEDEDVEVQLPEPRCVTDLRHRRSAGPTTRFATRVLGSRPTFLVLSEKPLPQAAASLKETTVKVGGMAILRVAVPGAGGLHALRIRAAPPDGSPADWLDRVVLVGRDPVGVPLPVAVNDPPGAWRVRAIDLFTERTAEVTLRVEPN
jgi:hypothetical protein